MQDLFERKCTTSSRAILSYRHEGNIRGLGSDVRLKDFLYFCLPMYNISHLLIGHHRQRIINKVPDGWTCSLPQGKVTCLLGRNGIGKSTLLLTLAGILPPLGGNIILDRQPLQNYSRKELARKVSLVLTGILPSSPIRVSQLVAMGRYSYTDFLGRMSKEDQQKATAAMQIMGIEELADRRVDELSDGERQKALMAKAIAQDTPVILLDEPTSFLDYPNKMECMKILQKMATEEGKTILLSTHDLDIAFRMADYFWAILPNKGICLGNQEELVRQKALEGMDLPQYLTQQK